MAQRYDVKNSSAVAEENLGAIIPIGIGKEVSLLRAEIVGMKNQISHLEAQVTAQAGIINKIQNNSGTQIFTGDVSAIVIGGLVILGVSIIWGGFYYRKAMTIEAAAKLLAHTRSEDEAKELAQKQIEPVKQAIKRALDS